MNSGPLVIKAERLAIEVIQLAKNLRDEKSEFILSKQIIRSGTNPGAMLQEAKNAESKKDFIHKLSIAQKESAETKYWLRLLLKTNYISKDEFSRINNLAEEVLKMLRSSILTTKSNLNKTPRPKKP